MKTPQEWVVEFSGKPTIETESLDGVYVTPSEITTIQRDAFDSGRVSGRVEEMNRVARLVEDELPMTAESFRKWARELESTPPATKSDVEVQK